MAANARNMRTPDDLQIPANAWRRQVKEIIFGPEE